MCEVAMKESKRERSVCSAKAQRFKMIVKRRLVARIDHEVRRIMIKLLSPRALRLLNDFVNSLRQRANDFLKRNWQFVSTRQLSKKGKRLKAHLRKGVA